MQLNNIVTVSFTHEEPLTLTGHIYKKLTNIAVECIKMRTEVTVRHLRGQFLASFLRFPLLNLELDINTIVDNSLQHEKKLTL